MPEGDSSCSWSTLAGGVITEPKASHRECSPLHLAASTMQNHEVLEGFFVGSDCSAECEQQDGGDACPASVRAGCI